MGRSGELGLADERRGWQTGDARHVCSDCVDDVALKAGIDAAVVSSKCDFCGQRDDRNIAAPFDHLVGLIAVPLLSMYGDVDRVGTPYADGGYLSEPVSTETVLEDIGFTGTKNVVAAVVNAFTIELWVEAPGGVWGVLPLGEELSFAWAEFSRVVKHQTRFHFSSPRHTRVEDGIEPADLLSEIGVTINKASLIKEIPATATFYRGRVKAPSSSWAPNADSFSAPPPNRASAGRMNPIGIPYLYLAMDVNTMVAELGPLIESEVIMGASFATTRPLNVVDFTNLPPIPSHFDQTRRHLHQHIYFLHRFVAEISQPADKSGIAEIHYLPTQVISEFIAQGFTTNEGTRVDGMLYPSAQNPGGQNLVLFPSRTGRHARFDGVQFVRSFDWEAVLRMTTIGGQRMPAD